MLLATTLLGLVSTATSVLGLERTVADIPCEWELKRKVGVPVVFLVEERGERGLCLDAKASSFSVQRRVDLDASVSARLRFRWQVKALPPGADFRGPLDDQAAQIFVLFKSGLSLKAINYIWDSSAPVGSVADYSVPLAVKIKTVVVATGSEKKGVWVTQQRNLRRDFETLFGEAFAGVRGVRFQVNSQYTGSRAVGCISMIEFSGD